MVISMFEPAFTFHTSEWDEGYRAGRRGCSGAHNPYRPGSHRARAWSMGLSEGRTKQLTLVGLGRPPEPQPQPPELPPSPEEPVPDPLPRAGLASRPIERDVLSLNV